MVVKQRVWIGSCVLRFPFLFNGHLTLSMSLQALINCLGTQHLLTSRVPIYTPPGLCKSMRERDSGTSIQVQVDGLVQIKAGPSCSGAVQVCSQQADNVRDFDI